VVSGTISTPPYQQEATFNSGWVLTAAKDLNGPDHTVVVSPPIQKGIVMRKAQGLFWDDKKRDKRLVVGAFHMWAAKYEEFESGPGNYTMALIEDENGQIRECWPDTVKFLEP